MEKISDVKRFGIFKNKLLILNKSNKISGNLYIDLFNNKITDFIGLENYLLMFDLDDKLNIINGEFQKIEKIENFKYPSFPIHVFGNYFLLNQYDEMMKQTQAIFQIENGIVSKFTEELPCYNFILGNYIGYISGSTIKFKNYINYKTWKSDISKYGKTRYDHRGNILPAETPNTISGETIGYEDTVVVPLAGGQLLGLNIEDGSFKWILEFENRQNAVSKSEAVLYVYNRKFLWEVAIQTGEITRQINISPIYIDKYNDWPNKSIISNGKLIIEFLKTENSLLIFDIDNLEKASPKIATANAFFRINNGDIIWHDNKLYARDPISNTLYVFEDEYSS